MIIVLQYQFLIFSYQMIEKGEQLQNVCGYAPTYFIRSIRVKPVHIVSKPSNPP